jgi:hypothetical protein
MTEGMSGSVPQRITTPNPDPTVLTTAALLREVAAVRELFDQRMADRDREFTALIRERDGQSEALQRLLEARIESESRVTEERFVSAERNRLEQKSDTQKAVDAALQAQKEAVREQTTASALSIAKSEAATAKQLEQQQITTSTALQSLRQSIDEMKERNIEDVRVLRQAINDVATQANTIAQQKVGAGEQRQEHTDNRVAVYTSIGLVVSLIIAAIAILGFIITETQRAGVT